MFASRISALVAPAGPNVPDLRRIFSFNNHALNGVAPIRNLIEIKGRRFPERSGEAEPPEERRRKA